MRSTRAEEILRPRVVMEPGRVTHAEQRAPDKPDRTSVGLFAIVPDVQERRQQDALAWERLAHV